jgi:hypothetical protein
MVIFQESYETRPVFIIMDWGDSTKTGYCFLNNSFAIEDFRDKR